jgi:hypothetical protein
LQLFLGSGDDNADEIINVYFECIPENVVDVSHRWECINGLSPTRILFKLVVGQCPDLCFNVRCCDVPCRFCGRAEIRR